jgi:penicillin-binding protein 2
VRGVGIPKRDRLNRPRAMASDETWAAIHTALEAVVATGTGTAARVPGIAVAGKTGTAQNPHGKDHALFVCYAPAEAPTIALAVVVENSGHGGSIAAPRAGRVLAEVLLPDSLRNNNNKAAPVAPPTRVGVTGAAD